MSPSPTATPEGPSPAPSPEISDPAPGGARRRRAQLAVAAAAVCFGSTFVVVQQALAQVGAAPFVAVRFLMASAALWPLARRAPRSPGLWRDGAGPALALLAGYLLQTAGLRTVASSVSAFITYMLVVLVPVMSAVLLRRLPPAATALGAAMAGAGLWLLTGRGVGFGVGEALTLGSAFAFALNIVLLGRVAARHDALRLTFVQMVVVGAGAVLPALLTGGWGFGPVSLAAALGTAVLASALAFWLQTLGQRALPPASVSLLLMVEPVVAAVLGALTGVHLGGAAWAGAVVILVGIALSEVGPGRGGSLRLRLSGSRRRPRRGRPG
ncbi:MAG: DMT family transporter [Acidimicrobiales bacterium]